jgi:hypothetical protein
MPPILGTLALALALSPLALAQTAPPAPPQTPETHSPAETAPAVRRSKVFALQAGEHELREMVDRAAAWLGRNYLVQDSDFQQAPPTKISVRLQTPLELDARGLEIALNQFLYQRGFAVIQLSAEQQLYSVVNLQGPRRGDVPAQARTMDADQVLDHAERIESVVVPIRLEHMNAQIAANAIRPFLAQTSSPYGGVIVGNFGDEKTVVIQGMSPQVAAAVRMIRAADAAAGEAQARQHVEQLEQRIQQLERGAAGR